ncbi:MAG: DUF523 domain-containing protein [Candidatus Nanoarchaeia archaeon]|nr:DUF523 domain-containing protein [Candidatus Nanoarchaeia archaeon]MDD5239232.1 DUF523 domain-containing protein [Candidatus Nanoarchaeia archaeon]
MKLVSGCLIGVKCSYNGKARPNKKLIEMFKMGELLPVCPEMLGGLPSPREPNEQKGKKVFTKSGRDVTKEFAKGAKEVMALVKKYNIKEAILKARSPSCGSGKVYDGTFSGKLIDGDGVLASILKRKGIKVITEEEV